MSADPTSRAGTYGPIAAVVVTLTALGAYANAAALAHPATIGPRTAFTPGQYLAAAVADAQLSELGRWATTTDLLGWPERPEFRVVMWPTQVLAAAIGALPAVNAVFTLGPAFNAVAGWALGRVLGLRPWAAAALGGLVGWSPWVREVLANGQLEQVVVGCVALTWATALWAVRGTADRAAPAWAVALPAVFGVTWAVGMTAPHLCMAACLGLAAWALPDLRTRAVRWAAVLVTAGVAALVANAYHSPNFVSGYQVFSPKGSEAHPGGMGGLAESATLPSLLLPPTERLTDIGTVHPTFLGLLPLLAAVVVWRSPATRRAALPATLALVALAAFSLGPDLPIWRWHVPGPFMLLGIVSPSITQSGSAYRMVGGAVVALSVCAAMAVRGPRSAVALLLGAWLETELVASRPLSLLPMDFTPDPVYEPFRAHTGAILDLPLVGGGCPAGAYHYAFEATRRLRPTPILPSAPGIYATIADLHPRVQAATHGADCGERLAALVAEVGFTGVVLHSHDPTCRPTPTLERCLTEAFGEGERAPGLRWWELPVR